MSTTTLVEVDSLIIQAIVNDEIDQISPSPHPGVRHPQSFMGAPLTTLPSSPDTPNRGGATREMRMDTLCCGAQGLSLLITAVKDGPPPFTAYSSTRAPRARSGNATRGASDSISGPSSTRCCRTGTVTTPAA